MPDELKEKIIEAILEEAERIKFGKIVVEVSVLHGKCASMQVETKRSVHLEIKQH